MGAGFAAADGAKVDIHGGFIDIFIAHEGAEVTISGGNLDLQAHSGSNVELLGTEFLLDGSPIDGLQQPGDSIFLANRNGELLQATLRDGTLFELVLSTASRATVGNISTGSELRLTLVPEPGSWSLAWIGVLALFRCFFLLPSQVPK